MFRALRDSKDGRARRSDGIHPKPEVRRAPNRPRMNVDIEGILKEELVEVFTVDRTKLLTAEQQKVIWKKEEKIRDSERRNATALEKQHEVDEEEKRKALEELYANVTKQKIEARREQIKAKKVADAHAKMEEQKRVSKAKAVVFATENGVKRPSEVHDHNDLLGEDEDPSHKKNPFGPKKYSNKFGPPVFPQTELPGEYGPDHEWDDAEDYGYSSKFPYQKKGEIMHKGNEALPPYVPPESAGSDEQGTMTTAMHNVDDEVSVESDGVETTTSYSDPGQKLTTDNLMGLELGLHHVDRAVNSLGLLLGKIMTGSYETRTPMNTAIGGYHYSGESEINVGVETDVRAETPHRVRPIMVDQSTQVWAKDILDAMESMAQLKEGEDRQTKEPLENDLIMVERKLSKRRDAMVLTRPAGYKDLELSIPVETVTFEAQTQVKDFEIDQAYAMERGIILPKDNILWPTVAEFDIEMASKRIQDYMEQCWTMDSKWMHYIQPIETISDDYRKRFVFEVKFSIPTPLNPIPIATASVFFIFEISHYAPKNDFVKVHYVVEGTRFVHIPGTLPFQDKWLWSVISDKVRVQRSIDF